MQTDEAFDRIHTHELPERLASGWSGAAARGARGLSALAIRLPDGRAYTYRPEATTLAIEKGDAAGTTVVELDEACWRGLWDSTETTAGLVLSGRAKVVAGKVADFMSWDPALRVLYEQLPPYDPEVPLLGSDGREVDPTTSFHPGDDPDRMADFLRTAGYLLVRDVLSAHEVDALLAAAERLSAAAREDDGVSWWSQHEDGRTLLGRVLNAEVEPRMRALPHDPRLREIVGLSDFELDPTAADSISVLFKRSGMVFDGKADQPWHRDCGLGGHKLMCPLMNASVFLKVANRETGESRFLPGSWRTAGSSIIDDDYTAGVGIEANPGDFAVHYGDGVHAGTPPTAADDACRISVVFEYGSPERSAEQRQAHYDQLMHDVDARVLRS